VEETNQSDPGFVVEWQLSQDADSVIDLSGAEAQVRRSDLATVPPASRVSTAR
jgi:hypothetical protein